MASPPPRKRSKAPATPTTPNTAASAPDDNKIIVNFQARAADKYVGVDCKEVSGFDRFNPHRVTFNNAMSTLIKAGGVRLITSKEEELHKHYKYGYGNIKDAWVHTAEAGEWARKIYAHVNNEMGASVVEYKFLLFTDALAAPTTYTDIETYAAALTAIPDPPSQNEDEADAPGLAARVTALVGHVEAAARARQRAESEYRAGTGDYLAAWTSIVAHQGAQMNLLLARRDELAARIDLFSALGAPSSVRSAKKAVR